MYELYGWNTPNGQKAIIALEEAGTPYRYHPIDISKGQQRTEAFKQISPDGKIPALVHHRETTIMLFESGSILLYLADQFPELNGRTDAQKAQVMSWTFWQVGQLGPLAGQFGRFHSVTPVNVDAIKHFRELVLRCLDVLERQLQSHNFLTGEHFTVADIASFPWVASPQSYLQRYEIEWREKYPALNAWTNRIIARPSVTTALQR